jgi:hypothetical protein
MERLRRNQIRGRVRGARQNHCNRINADEADLRKEFVQTGAVDEISRIPFSDELRQHPTQLVHWIPRIALIEDHLPAGREKHVYDPEKLR